MSSSDDPTILYRVVAPHFVAGVIYDPKVGRIIKAAPILAWSTRMSFRDFLSYARRKRWGVAAVVGTADGAD